MQKSWFISLAFVVLFLVPYNHNSAADVDFSHLALSEAPLPPNTAQESTPDETTEKVAQEVVQVEAPESRYPTRIRIPSIKLDTKVQLVGINELGEMDVPSGKTNNVGWYSYGTIPGDRGSAVLDAHVYAAFRKLKKVPAQSSIYIEDARGETLEFIVIASKSYPLHAVPADIIFTDASGVYVNLITCEGTFIPSQNTYTHRRIIYAKLAGT